jgi:hypothetical protein
MIVGEAQATVAAAPKDVFEFVFDLERYRQADHKIGKVGRIERNGDSGTVEFNGRIMGLPGPRGVYPYTVTPTRLQFGSPIAGPAKWFLDFEGTFDCKETPEGTVVTHREAFTFKAPWRWLVEPLLRRWLENDTAAEMVRVKEMVERDARSQGAA